MPPKTTKKKRKRKKKASPNGRAPAAPPYINPNLAALVRPIEGLREDPGNARLHPQRNLDDIRRSLFAFHQQTPIVALKDGTVIKGNGTLRVALALGWDRIACIEFDGTAEDATAYGIADNRTGQSSEWDDEKLADLLSSIDGDVRINTGFDETEIGELLHGLGRLGTPEGDGKTGADDVPDPPDKPIAKPGDVWVMGDHRIICGDALERDTYSQLLGDERPELLLTDPPYGVAYQDAAKNRLQGDLTQAAFPIAVACAVEVLSDNVLRHNGYHSQFEMVLYAWKGSGGGLDFWNGDRKQSDVWNVSRDGDRLHPTQKPVEVCSIPLRNSSKAGDIVLEPFAGSGSTIIACEQLGRRCRAIEIEPRWVDCCVKRWEEYTGRTAERVAPGQ
jgi:hypothetical protein